jgi:DNA-binding GntR family transcriptional regulator
MVKDPKKDKRRTIADARRKTSGEPLDQPIYDAIFEAVLRRKLAPGEKLIEASLAESFKVSRTIVRQALQRLAQAQVIELTLNKGARVSAPSPQETRDVFEARRAIEGAIIPLCVARATRPWIERLRQRLAAEDESLRVGDHSRWVRLAGDFHLSIAEMAGNEVLLKVLTELMIRCSLIVAMYEAPGESDCEHHEHVALVDRIELGDVDGAITIMDKHLRALESHLRIPDPHYPLLHP